MSQSELGRIINATVEPLGDIARASCWRRIEAEISRPPVRRPRHRAAVAAMVVAVVALWIGLREGPRWRVDARAPLVAGDGIEVERQLGGVLVRLRGPGAVGLVSIGESHVVATMDRGVVVVRRAAGAPDRFTVRSGETAMDVNDAYFAVRVQEGRVVMASGTEPVRQLLEDAGAVTLRAEVGAPAEAPAVVDVVPVAPDVVVDVAPDDAGRAPGAPRAHIPPAPEPRRVRAVERAPAPADAAPSPVDAAPSAAALYARAERALGLGERVRAERLLERVVQAEPAGALAAAARYDLALLAWKRDDSERALGLLDMVMTGGDRNLRAAADRLRCRILRSQGRGCE